MPYSRPTLSTLKQQVASDIQSLLEGSDPLLRFSNLGITGVALANLVNALYGYLDWISKQAVPFTASGEFMYGWGALKNVTPLPAEPATNGAITFQGSNGTPLPSGTSLTRGDGATFTTTSAGTVSNGTVTVNAKATIAGSVGNTSVGSVMTLGTSIAGIQSSGTVSTAFTNGTDIETDEAYQTRMLGVYQNPPQGGAQKDYVTWAEECPIVTRAWCNPNGFGVGTVVVYVMCDTTEAAFGGFPQGTNGISSSDNRGTVATGDLLTVANYIYSLQPVTALVWVVAPIANVINFTISGITSASATTKSAISAAITEAFLQQGSPLGSVVDLSYIESAIANIPGTAGFVITSPSANITSSTGYLPVLGTITYD